VLPHSRDALDDATGDGRVAIDVGQLRQSGFKARHRLTRERLVQRPRGAIDGVAFRHVWVRQVR
jgi:hypothetical protein